MNLFKIKRSSDLDRYSSNRGSAMVELAFGIPLVIAIVLTALDFSNWFSFYQKINFLGREIASYTVRKCIVTEDPWVGCFTAPVDNADPAPDVHAGTAWKKINSFVTDADIDGLDRFGIRIRISIWKRDDLNPNKATLVVSKCIRPSVHANANLGGSDCGADPKYFSRVDVAGPKINVELKESIVAQNVISVVEVFSTYRSVAGFSPLNWALSLQDGVNYYRVLS